jgi:hypothetical protein
MPVILSPSFFMNDTPDHFAERLKKAAATSRRMVQQGPPADHHDFVCWAKEIADLKLSLATIDLEAAPDLRRIVSEIEARAARLIPLAGDWVKGAYRSLSAAEEAATAMSTATAGVEEALVALETLTDEAFGITALFATSDVDDGTEAPARRVGAALQFAYKRVLKLKSSAIEAGILSTLYQSTTTACGCADEVRSQIEGLPVRVAGVRATIPEDTVMEEPRSIAHRLRAALEKIDAAAPAADTPQPASSAAAGDSNLEDANRLVMQELAEQKAIALQKRDALQQALEPAFYPMYGDPSPSPSAHATADLLNDSRLLVQTLLGAITSAKAALAHARETRRKLQQFRRQAIWTTLAVEKATTAVDAFAQDINLRLGANALGSPQVADVILQVQADTQIVRMSLATMLTASAHALAAASAAQEAAELPFREGKNLLGYFLPGQARDRAYYSRIKNIRVGYLLPGQAHDRACYSRIKSIRALRFNTAPDSIGELARHLHPRRPGLLHPLAVMDWFAQTRTTAGMETRGVLEMLKNAIEHQFAAAAQTVNSLEAALCAANAL